jgi:UDPglucose 6-dehydrogenase
MFLAEGCTIAAYDPAAIERTEQILPAAHNLSYANSAYEAAKDADALLILTDWQEFADLDLSALHKALRYAIVIDGRNVFDPQVMLQHGFTYLSIGRPAATPARELAAPLTV